MRYLTILLLALTVCGCPDPNAPRPGTPSAQPTTAATTQPRPAEVMATVNGRPIYMELLYGPLLEAHGLRLAEALIADELIAQEAEKRNVTVTRQDIENEEKLALQAILPKDFDRAQRQQALERLLLDRNVTRTQWNAAMRRNALLRKMVTPGVTVPEAMIKAEFARVYGEKLRVSHIQLPSLAEAEKIIGLLKKGEDFAQLARRYSTNTATARQDGALPIFTREDSSAPRAIRDVAFTLKPGQISGVVQVGNNFHVLKLHQRILASGTDYAKVREQLREQVHRRLVKRELENLLSLLRRDAAVEYVNPILRREAAKLPRP